MGLLLPVLALATMAQAAPQRVPVPAEAVAAARRNDQDSAFQLGAEAADQCRKARRPADSCLDLLLWSAEVAPAGEQARAEDLARAGLAIAGRLPAANHADRLRAAEALARAIDEKGYDYSQDKCGGPCTKRWKEAEPHYRRALDLRLRHFPADHAGLARLRQSLARNLTGQKRAAESYEQEKLALDPLEAGLPGTAAALAQAFEGLIYDREEKLDFREAESLHRRQIAWLQRGAADVTLVRAVVRLAANLATQGRPVDAEPEYRRALDLVGTVPEASDSLPDIYLGLARILEERDERAEAEPLLRRAVALDLADPDFGGDEQIESSRRLAANLERQGRPAEAEQVYRTLLGRLDRASPGVRAVHMAMLAVAIDAQGRAGEAETIFREALSMVRESDEMLIELLRSEVLRRFAASLDRRGRHAEAEPMYREAAMFWLQIAPWHVLLAPTYAALAANLEAQGKMDAALVERRKIYALWADRFGASHPERIAATADLAAASQRGDDLPQAYALYREAASGAIDRSRAWRDFGPVAAAEIRRYQPLFAGEVAVAWALARRAVP